MPRRTRPSLLDPSSWEDEPGRKCAGCGVDISEKRANALYCDARCRHLFVTYGIGLAQFQALFEAQNGRCAICKRKQNYQSLAVDHAHKSSPGVPAGTVRGLLCKRCNHDLLGAAFDSAVVMQAGADYLTTPPALAVIGHQRTPTNATRSTRTSRPSGR